LLHFRTNLLVNLLPQVARDQVSELPVAHVASENLMVLIHAVDEPAFQRLIEYVVKVVQRIGDRGLLDVGVRHGFFPNLIEEELVGGFELGSEPKNCNDIGKSEKPTDRSVENPINRPHKNIFLILPSRLNARKRTFGALCAFRQWA
jgi:hypothetical protein